MFEGGRALVSQKPKAERGLRIADGRCGHMDGARRVGIDKGEPDPLSYFLPEERDGTFELHRSMRAPEGRNRKTEVLLLNEPYAVAPSAAWWLAGGAHLAASARERLPQRRRLWLVSSFAIGAVVGLVVLQWFGTSPSANRSGSSLGSAPTDVALPSSLGSVATTPVSQPAEVEATAPAPQPSRSSAPVVVTNYRGGLRIDSQPSGATVFVNDQRIGQTPIALSSLPVGSRAVRLELEQHGTWSGAVRVVANQTARLSIRLDPAR